MMNEHQLILENQLAIMEALSHLLPAVGHGADRGSPMLHRQCERTLVQLQQMQPHPMRPVYSR